MSDPRTQTWKRYTLVLIQGALAAGALALVFHDRQRRHEVAQAVRHASISWMLAGLIVYGFVELLGGMRWVLLLRVQGFRLPWRRATAIFLIGLFLMTFTPGLIGGDAARVFYVIREAPERKTAALLAVAMDRFIGLISLIILAALVVLFRYHWLAQTPATSGLEYVTLIILGGALVMLILSAIAARLPWLAMLDRYPSISVRLKEIANTFRAYQCHRAQLILALFNTLVAHSLYFVTFYCAARSLGAFGSPGAGLFAGFWDVFSIMPILNTITSLPISFAGIGIRESIFQVLLNDLCNIPSGVGAATGSLGFAMRAIWSLPGAWFLFQYRSSRKLRRDH